MRFGYTLMTEQSGPRALVDYAIRAEQLGFDFEVSSDHYSPWLTEQGHAPYAWSVLGAVAQATTRVELATYVTCPIQRYHPAVVAQKAATLSLLSEGRFLLGLGSGENLNEHVTGEGWPPIAQRQGMLEEAATIIRELFGGELVTWEGDYFRVDSARLWDPPEHPLEIGIAASGEKSIERFAGLADHLIAVEPEKELVTAWDRAKGGPSRKIGQVPICWDPDPQVALWRAHEQFRWFGGGWGVNADLPTPAGFAAASQFVRPDDVANSIPCGPDLDAIVDAVRPYWEAGFTDVSPWCRSATTGSRSSSSRPPQTCSPNCAPLTRARDAQRLTPDTQRLTADPGPRPGAPDPDTGLSVALLGLPAFWSRGRHLRMRLKFT